MAEQPARYCSNCGQELKPEDQFCPNCGTPVHRAAHVPTPEADVPVPPPPQAGGTSATTAGQPAQGPATQGQPAQAGFGSRHPILTGCLGIIALLALLGIVGAVIGGGGGGQQAADSPPERAEQDEGVEGGGPDPEAKQPLEGEKANGEKPQEDNKPPPPPEYSVGQTATVGNVEWTIKNAYRTQLLRSNFGTRKQGNFVVVDFTFTNNRDEEVTLDPELHLILKDDKGREFGTDIDAWEFVPTRLNIFLEPVNPGISQEGRAIYEVPPDAGGFTLTVDDVEFFEDKSARYDLSGLPTHPYNPRAAAAG